MAPASLEVNFSRGFYSYYFDRDWRQAKPHFQKAIAINPRSSLAQVYYGLYLTSEGRGEEAIHHVMLAEQIDPLAPYICCMVAATQFIVGHFEESERATQRALELQPDHLLALWPRGLALSALGRHEEAITMLERAVTLSRAPIFVGLLGCVYARAGRLDDARKAALWYKDVYGDFYLEIQRHPIAELERINSELIIMSRELGIPLVASNDVHYINREDAATHDLLLCIGTNTSVKDEKRIKMAGDFFYLRSREEMAELYRDLPEAIENTGRIAQMCDLKLDFERAPAPAGN
jgi:tetratricopeptide (TPR) repeat protein